MRYFILFILAVSVVHGEFEHPGGLIDIPVATPPKETFFSVIPSGSFALGDDSLRSSIDVTLSFSIARRGEISLSAFTPKDYALHFKLSVLREEEVIPALAVGIDNITNNQWISSVGSGESTGFTDDVSYGRERPKEFFSAFLVATKNMGNLPLPIHATIGIGRGKFVGRGPLSKYTNSDIFFDKNHSEAIGMFGGLAIEFLPHLSAIVEYDGRDGNLGLRYHPKHFDFNLAFTHLEQFRSGGSISPRIALGLALKSTILTPPKKGLISGKVYDAYSKAPIDASIAFSDVKLEPVFFRGNYLITIPPGTYSLKVSSKGYYGKKFRVSIKPDKEIKLDVPLINIAMDDSVKLHMSKGEELMRAGKIRLAKEEFSSVLRFYPEHPEAKEYQLVLEEKIRELIANHKRLAADYSNKGRIEDAILEWKGILELNPNDPEAINSIERLQKKLEELEKEAQAKPEPKPKAPKKKRRPEPPKMSAEELEALYQKALVHYYNEEYEQALKLFERILKVNPNHAKARKYLERTKRILGL